MVMLTYGVIIMAYSKPKGDVSWYKPDAKRKAVKTVYLEGLSDEYEAINIVPKGRPIAFSTTATSDLIVILAEDGCTIEELKDKIIYDIEAKEIIQKYIDLGYGKLVAKDYFK